MADRSVQLRPPHTAAARLPVDGEERGKGQRMSLTAHETAEIERANASGLRPVLFVHGLWLLSSSWDRWRGVFEEAGYTSPSHLRLAG